MHGALYLEDQNRQGGLHPRYGSADLCVTTGNGRSHRPRRICAGTPRTITLSETRLMDARRRFSTSNMRDSQIEKQGDDHYVRDKPIPNPLPAVPACSPRGPPPECRTWHHLVRRRVDDHDRQYTREGGEIREHRQGGTSDYTPPPDSVEGGPQEWAPGGGRR